LENIKVYVVSIRHEKIKIKKVDFRGGIRVDAKDLANGLYIYSLLPEGQLVNARGMLRSR